YRLASISIFCTLLAGIAVYWYLDRVIVGMIGARELASAEAPVLRTTVERLATRAGVARPRIYLLPDAHPRALAADRAAAEVCESPHGLAEALLRLEQAGELVEFRASPATEPLYTVNPFAEEDLAAMFVTHPPLGERVRRLPDL